MYMIQSRSKWSLVVRNSFVAVCLLAVLSSSSSKADTRPNILIITADDLGLQLGCYGSNVPVTPKLDQLAAQGIIYKNAFCAQSSCSASRCSLFTGLTPHQSRQVGLSQFGFKSVSSPNMVSLLRAAGYFTGIQGKLHIEPQGQYPFERVYGSLQPTRDPYLMAQSATSFFQEAKARNRPFFLYLNSFDPHGPYDQTMDQVRGIPQIPFTASNFSWALPFPSGSVAVNKTYTAHYFNAVRRLDAAVGMVLQSLKSQGLENNTIVFFVSDNGPQFTKGKTTAYENGIHVPLLVKWPGHIAPGQVRTEPVGLIDIFPTVLKLANVSIPSQQSGMILEGVFNWPLNVWRGYVYSEMNFHGPDTFRPQRSVRGLQFQFIRTYRPGNLDPTIEMYDLYADPQQMKNLAADPNYLSQVTTMNNVLLNWQIRTQDPLLNANKRQVWFQVADQWKSKAWQVINSSVLPY
jgi:N-sulfoglucosamine sulfohydrolase